jgi:hypothetical protein
MASEGLARACSGSRRRGRPRGSSGGCRGSGTHLRGYPRQEYIPSRRVLVRACWIHTAAGDQNKALTAAEELSRNVEAELDAQESLDRCELAHSDAQAGQG